MHRNADDAAALTPRADRNLPVLVRRPAAPIPQLDPVANAAAPARARRPWGTWTALLAITLFGGFLRFYNLTFPALWNDETLVFWRVCGTYGQMLVPLRFDGFPPLHYSLYWLMGHPVNAIWYFPVNACSMLTLFFLLAFAGVNLFRSRLKAGVYYTTSIGSAGLLMATLVTWYVCIAFFQAGWPARSSSQAPGLLGLTSLVLFHTWWGTLVHWHYHLQLTPWVIRFVPALAGTLTIPAMYFLARQMFSRGTSLVAALFTACSAFMLFYSRDAKMYPHMWLMVTLNVACLLWWLRTRKSTSYLCWIAAGCAMAGLHASALAGLAISVLILLTYSNITWKTGVLFIVGLALIAAGPIGYFTKFNVWNERVEEEGWSASGLGWVGGFFNGNRTGPDHTRYATSAFLIGWEWPREDYLPLIPPPLYECPRLGFLEMLGILAVGLLPWPLRWRPRRDLDPPPQAQWRVYFWIVGWVLPVAFIFYAHSVRNFVSPRRWRWELEDALDPWEWAVVGGVLLAFLCSGIRFRSVRPAIGRFIALFLATVALFYLCEAAFVVCYRISYLQEMVGHAWQSIWTPRYLGILWPAVGLAVAGLLMRLPTRAVRIGAIVFVMAINLGMFSLRMTLGTEPPIGIQAKDEWEAQTIKGTTPDKDIPPKVHTYDYIVRGGIAVAESAMDPYVGKVTAGRYYIFDDLISAQKSRDPGNEEYYLPNDSAHRPMSPSLFAESLYYYDLRQSMDGESVKQDISAAPGLERVIFWIRQYPRQPVNWGWDRTLLPPGWRLKKEDIYAVRNPWDWRDFATWIRREYVRQPGIKPKGATNTSSGELAPEGLDRLGRARAAPAHRPAVPAAPKPVK